MEHVRTVFRTCIIFFIFNQLRQFKTHLGVHVFSTRTPIVQFGNEDGLQLILDSIFTIPITKFNVDASIVKKLKPQFKSKLKQ